MSLYDFIIIGSGVSGGRIAFDLTNAGAQCLLLEAGREFNAQTFPKNEMEYSTQMFWGGGIEMNTHASIGFLRAKVLGGTSIVNQALLDRFDDLAWNDWKQRSNGIDFFNRQSMEPHYQACEKTLSIQQIPQNYHPQNAKLFQKALKNLNLNSKLLDRGQKDCKLEKGSDCIVCLGGCPRDSKQSSLVTTIRKAREQGLQIQSRCEVKKIQKTNDGFHIFATQDSKPLSFAAKKVVLASGSFGNTAILKNSNIKLKSLGEGFSCHPQYMTYALFDEPIDAHKGAFQAIKSEDTKIRLAGYKFENVYAPPVGTAMLMPGFGKEHMQNMLKYRYYASMEIAVRDEPTGKIDLQKNGKLKVTKKLTSQDLSRVQHGLKLVDALFSSLNPKKIIRCPQAFGLHLMGGCAIGTDPKTSVVNPEFEVWDHPGIFIADSSIFPEAPGINPSFTIMALSHRAGQNILKK